MASSGLLAEALAGGLSPELLLEAWHPRSQSWRAVSPPLDLQLGSVLLLRVRRSWEPLQSDTASGLVSAIFGNGCSLRSVRTGQPWRFGNPA